MLAVDTNLIVRYLVGDDQVQYAKAVSLIEGSDVFVSATVLLETEWVLRSAYGFSGGQVSHALRQLAGLANVRIEGAARLARALDWADDGLDFADALHLASAAGCDAFVTFDKDLIKAAQTFAAPRVRLP